MPRRPSAKNSQATDEVESQTERFTHSESAAEQLGTLRAQLERLVAATDTQTNMLARLVALQSEPACVSFRAPRTRRRTDERPLDVSPIVEAAVRRSLERVQRFRR